MSSYAGLSKGLIIKAPFIDWIMEGRKTWELRSTHTQVRGPIALIQKGTGSVVAVARLVDSKGPLSAADMAANLQHHAVAPDRLAMPDLQKYRFAWVLGDVKRLARPVSYTHRNGAVIWVALDLAVAGSVLGAAG
ncbi:ASCH domain-containing protein [Pseudaquabacterium pictum]|uniref:ASCH domain-containing protein n=1 Tax=Pseudaquabacterium pictum TaxID=2315236 RepID=A0A480ATY3_9BURK|nr:ASCH domain-containing protein [Rubrivivax pictus]GCL65159.1 hypothetical protein AQPW35_42400 [Rubrivivax pictus]